MQLLPDIQGRGENETTKKKPKQATSKWKTLAGQVWGEPTGWGLMSAGHTLPILQNVSVSQSFLFRTHFWLKKRSKWAQAGSGITLWACESLCSWPGFFKPRRGTRPNWGSLLYPALFISGRVLTFPVQLQLYALVQPRGISQLKYHLKNPNDFCLGYYLSDWQKLATLCWQWRAYNRFTDCMGLEGTLKHHPVQLSCNEQRYLQLDQSHIESDLEYLQWWGPQPYTWAVCILPLISLEKVKYWSACSEGPGSAGRQLAEHESAVCSGGREGQCHVGLYPE